MTDEEVAALGAASVAGIPQNAPDVGLMPKSSTRKPSRLDRREIRGGPKVQQLTNRFSCSLLLKTPDLCFNRGLVMPPPTPLPDEKLVAQVLSDPDEGMKSLLARHGPVMKALIRRQGFSKEDCEEVY